MSQKNLFNIKPMWTARRMKQENGRQCPEDVNLDRHPGFELNCDINYIIFNRH